jgi:hypothetical protein
MGCRSLTLPTTNIVSLGEAFPRDERSARRPASGGEEIIVTHHTVGQYSVDLLRAYGPGSAA